MTSKFIQTTTIPKLQNQRCHGRASQTEFRGLWTPIKSNEVAVQTYMHRSITSDEDATDFASITECKSYNGAWTVMSEFNTLQIGDFVRIEKDTKSMNPEIIIEEGLYGKVRKIDNHGNPLVYIPEVDFFSFGEHWVKKSNLRRLQKEKFSSDRFSLEATNSS